MNAFAAGLCKSLLVAAGFALAIVANDMLKWLVLLVPILAWLCVAPVAAYVFVLLAAFAIDNQRAYAFCGWSVGILLGWMSSLWVFVYCFWREGWDLG